MKRHEFNTLVDGLIGDLPDEVQDAFTARYAGHGTYIGSRIEVTRNKLSKEHMDQVTAAATALGFKEAQFNASQWGAYRVQTHREDKELEFHVNRWLVEGKFKEDASDDE